MPEFQYRKLAHKNVFWGYSSFPPHFIPPLSFLFRRLEKFYTEVCRLRRYVNPFLGSQEVTLVKVEVAGVPSSGSGLSEIGNCRRADLYPLYPKCYTENA